VGKGTRVTIVLPLTAARNGSDAAVPARDIA
jgi:hypothetical protein